MAATNIYALPPFWKKIKKNRYNYSKIPTLLKKLIGFEKLNSRELVSLLVYTHPITTTSQSFLVMLDSYSRFFKCNFLKTCIWLPNSQI